MAREVTMVNWRLQHNGMACYWQNFDKSLRKSWWWKCTKPFSDLKDFFYTAQYFVVDSQQRKRESVCIYISRDIESIIFLHLSLMSALRHRSFYIFFSASSSYASVYGRAGWIHTFAFLFSIVRLQHIRHSPVSTVCIYFEWWPHPPILIQYPEDSKLVCMYMRGERYEWMLERWNDENERPSNRPKSRETPTRKTESEQDSVEYEQHEPTVAKHQQQPNPYTPNHSFFSRYFTSAIFAALFFRHDTKKKKEKIADWQKKRLF